MKIHSAHLLALWLWLLSCLPWLERFALFGLAVVMAVASLYFARARLLRSLPRMRWLFLAVMVIFAWTTPGLYVFPYWFSPTEEGLLLGLEQGGRLLVVVCSLQILLTFLAKKDIVSALYYCMKPLGWLGLDVERFAVRLALTLLDAETLLEQGNTFSDLLQSLMAADVASLPSEVLYIEGLLFRQTVLLIVQFLLIVLTVLIGNFVLWT